MYSLLRKCLFCLPPEGAHALSLSVLNHLPRFFVKQPPQGKSVQAMGLNFPHAIGLAAGLDKNADYVDGLAKLGFSFIEVGTVTPKPQQGNPKPRLFRLPQAQALINRMGFNNKGVDALVTNIQRMRYSGIIGINIGKNKDTSLNEATNDYRISLQAVYPYASYITINVSSPNTQDLRQLQEEGYFRALLKGLCEEQKRLSDTYQRWVPLVVKLSPDESIDTIKRMVQLILEKGIQGIIATNTTTSHELVSQYPYGKEQGGVSGLPLYTRSTECLRLLKQEVGSAVSLIGVGGIADEASFLEKKAAGADLIQLYTGFIYQGPDLIRRLIQLDLNEKF